MLVIINGKIKTMEDRDYEDGYVRIEQGRISAVGDMQEIEKDN